MPYRDRNGRRWDERQGAPYDRRERDDVQHAHEQYSGSAQRDPRYYEQGPYHDYSRRYGSRHYDDRRDEDGRYRDDLRYGTLYGPDREGPHRGKGPKGYRRSDETIREEFCAQLMHDPHLDASNIEVMVRECEVTLAGTVPDRWSRRRAEDLADGVPGIVHIRNNLRVQSSATP